MPEETPTPPAPDNPWYKRTEFWAMVVVFGYGVAASTGTIDPETAETMKEVAMSPDASVAFIKEQAFSQWWGKIAATVGAPLMYIISRGFAKMRR